MLRIKLAGTDGDHPYGVLVHTDAFALYCWAIYGGGGADRWTEIFATDQFVVEVQPILD